jgi:Flp pilus assembly protein TadB
MIGKLIKFSGIVLLVFVLLSVGGCKSVFVNNPAKKAAKKQEKEQRNFQKNYQKATEAHYKSQSKETRKRMKKNLRKAEAKNKKSKPAKGWDCR